MTSPRLFVYLGLLLGLWGCGEGDPHQLNGGSASAAETAVDGPPVNDSEPIELHDERRRAVVRRLAPWSWSGRVPRQGLLSIGAALMPEATGPEREDAVGLEVRAELLVAGERELLDIGRGAEGLWIDLRADLSRYSGRNVEIFVSPRQVGNNLGAGHREVAWSSTRMSQKGAGADKPPNVLFILIDTLRADHLTPYGYSRPTSPAIASELAARGVVVETAYSQAPWTVPSVASLMTSRYPGEILSGPMEGYLIPAGSETMAERFQRLGYQTAAFYGNSVLRDANGFGRGFDTRFTPPAVPESNLLSAEAVNRRAMPWLRAHQHEPFFLYVHYMDPHDPYNSPELRDGRSPFFPDYRGNFSGLWIHGLYTGALKLADPEQDLAHLKALYDSEIRTADRAVGELLATLEPEVLANTLIVLTADHGEEFLDHGGWKHGQTLYQEQIHVPLIVRWDGRLPAGRRLAGTVQLLDLLPTMNAAAGGEADPAWQGLNLLPMLAGERELPRRAAFAQHLASGPLRTAAVVENKKLILFNREQPFEPANALIGHLWKLDRERLARQEVYDLERDAAEQTNLAPLQPELANALEAAVVQPLDRSLSGMRLMASGLPAGSRLDVRILFDAPPERDSWLPLFLSAADEVRWQGSTLELAWVGEAAGQGPVEKGLLLPETVGGVVAIEARLEAPGGEDLPREEGLEVLFGPGSPYRRGALSASSLTVDHRPGRPTGPALRLWIRRGSTASKASGAAIDPEVEKSLRALGYIQ